MCSVDELPPGAMKLVDVGKFGVGVYNVRGSLHAIVNYCSHEGAPLFWATSAAPTNPPLRSVSITSLEPMCDAQLPQAEHVLKSTYNDWLADVWLDKFNKHGRWRGSISVGAQTPELAAREGERWAGHPYFVQVLMTPQTRGVPFGSPHFDPLYAAASRNGFPVATHLMGQTPFELIPTYPVGNPAHWHDFFASWPLLYVSHLMSLVFDGAFDRHPDLRVVFIEGGFTWAMPMMWRMDRMWETRSRRSTARAPSSVGVCP